MYTRSFPSRRMPPDYGGTALVIKSNDEISSETNNTDGFSSDMRPRRTLISRPLPQTIPIPSAPFGISGQEDAKEADFTDDEEHALETDTDITDISRKPVFFDPENLKSDDLLLLGIALMLLYDKDENGSIPLDALLIIAMIYLSGL